MGHHFVPQAHLRRFQVDELPGTIWMFDKQTNKFSSVAIKNAAQQRQFYDPAIESALAEVVEVPGSEAISRIISGKSLSLRQRSYATMYILTMATRGPQFRNALYELFPQVAKEFFFDALKVSNNDKEVAVWGTLFQKTFDATPAAIDSIAPAFREFARVPFWSELLLEYILNMRWHIFKADPPDFFVTGELPVHIFNGIGTPYSELTIPLSKEIALLGEHRSPKWGTSRHQKQNFWIKEINRRIISSNNRFIFSPTDASWIQAAALRKNVRPLPITDAKFLERKL